VNVFRNVPVAEFQSEFSGLAALICLGQLSRFSVEKYLDGEGGLLVNSVISHCTGLPATDELGQRTWFEAWKLRRFVIIGHHAGRCHECSVDVEKRVRKGPSAVGVIIGIGLGDLVRARDRARGVRSPEGVGRLLDGRLCKGQPQEICETGADSEEKS